MEITQRRLFDLTPDIQLADLQLWMRAPTPGLVIAEVLAK